MADAVKPQSFANHRHFPPLTLAVLLILAANTVLAIVGLCRFPSLLAAWAVVLGAALVVVMLEMRRGLTTLQDRLIRLEMGLRLAKVLPAERHGEIARLSVKQLVGLRFASDAELPALVTETLAQNLDKPDAIKLKVKDWQADWLRA